MQVNQQAPSDIDESGKILINLIDASKRDRAHFEKVAEELDKYDGQVLASLNLSEQNWNPEQSYFAKLNKTQQFKREIGAILMNDNPKFQASQKRGSIDPQNAVRARLMTDLLNHSVAESDFIDDAKIVVNDALGYGRGVMWFGIDLKKKIPVAVPVSPKDVFIDPDARSWREVRWVARRRLRSKEELSRKYPEKRGAIYSEPGYDTKSDEGMKVSADGFELVEFYEVYMLQGLWNYKGSAALPPEQRARMKNKPVKYVVTASNQRVLYEGDWETPFHRESGRAAWPCECLDFYLESGSMWPQAPMEPGIPWMKACNEIITGIIVKQRRAARRLIIMLESEGVKLGDDAEDKIVYGTDLVDTLTIQANMSDGEIPDIRKIVQEWSESNDFAADLAVYERFNYEWEKETGLSDFMYFGQAQRQDRSAAATNVKERNARKRIDYMGSVLDEFMSRVGRKLAIEARFHLSADDIKDTLGDGAAQAWGTLMSPNDMDIEGMANQYMDAGVSPDVVMGLIQDVMKDAVDFDKFFQETDYQIELGSLRRRTPEEIAEKAEIGMNQGYAAALNGGMPLTANILLRSWLENALNMSPEQMAIADQESQQLAQRLAAQQQAETMAAQQQAQPQPMQPMA